MLTAVPRHQEPVTEEYPYHFNQVLKSGSADSLWRPYQAFEALLSVLFSTDDMKDGYICVFDWDEVQPKPT